MKFKIRQAEPRKKDTDFRLEANFKYEDYLIENHGYSVMWLNGGIGYGSKTHQFRVVGKIVNDTLYVASCLSLCGSEKYNSGLHLHSDQEMIVNCKKCNR